MGSNAYKKFQPYGKYIEFNWFIVQYDQNTLKCTRKVVKSEELMWNEELELIECDDGESREHVLVNDGVKLHLAYIIYKSKTEEECLEQHHFLQCLLIQTLNDCNLKPLSKSHNPEELYRDQNYWVLVVYNRSTVKKDQAVLAVFHRKDVTIKEDGKTHAQLAFIKEDNVTYKGLVAKCNSDLEDILFMMSFVKKEMLTTFLEYSNMSKDSFDLMMTYDISVELTRMTSQFQELHNARQQLEKRKTEVIWRIKYAMNKLLQTRG